MSYDYVIKSELVIEFINEKKILNIKNKKKINKIINEFLIVL